ncbi:hypothetical protein CA260_10480 [Dyella jiangningensis]|uniref:Uncharacterized protein n=1 Tax=Dyella jiangningensis TaxID=1379159 RepID=A0A328P7Z8_9GAMM|nr:hypothetical protein CA260_10480 [Dyella jiangningensis]
MNRARWLSFVFIVFLLGWCALSMCGFSTTKFAFVYDQCFIDAAVKDVLVRYPPNLRTVQVLGGAQSIEAYGPPSDPIPYVSMQEFMEINPDCCRFVGRGSEGYQPSTLSYLLGYEWRIVRVRYALRYKTERAFVEERPVEEYVVLSRDGHVFRPR